MESEAGAISGVCVNGGRVGWVCGESRQNLMLVFSRC